MVVKTKGMCPVCGSKDMDVELYTYKIPVEGDVILFVSKCETCGYKSTDVIPFKLEGVDRLVINLPEDAGKIVYVPPSTEIHLERLGHTLRLTEAFKGRITTGEGVLRLFEENISNERIKKDIEKALKEGERIILVNKDKAIKTVDF